MIFDLLNVFTLGALGAIEDAFDESDRKEAHDDYIKLKAVGMSDDEAVEFLKSKYRNNLGR